MDKRKTILAGVLGVLVIVFLVVYMNFFRTCTVTFTLKIGPGIQAQEVMVGHTATEPVTPTADGYVFDGWYLDGKLYDFKEPVKKDIILEAKWIEKTDK